VAGWNTEKINLGCTDITCLKSLGQIGIAKLITGSVGKIGNIYAISLNLFDTQSTKMENGVSEVCGLEDALAAKFQSAVRKLFLTQSESLPPSLQIAENAITDRTFTNSIGMQFVRIEPGNFIIGSPSNEPGRDRDEGPQHEVVIANPFYISVYEVTQAQYIKIMHENPPYFSGFKECGSNCPVENMKWKDVQEFISKLNMKEMTNKYRLPTEAEWEYSCRAGSKTVYSFGNDPSKLGEYAWHRYNSTGKNATDGSPHPLGQKRPNAWGLYDMHGNVNEWVQDWYGAYDNKPKTDPTGQDFARYKVFRGGGWSQDDSSLRGATRGKEKIDNWTHSIGFRLVRTP
jgi:formylglycine-generating enzyme required for sulfatase activity